jgi:hypothetical protein
MEISACAVEKRHRLDVPIARGFDERRGAAEIYGAELRCCAVGEKPAKGVDGAALRGVEGGAAAGEGDAAWIYGGQSSEALRLDDVVRVAGAEIRLLLIIAHRVDIDNRR